MTKEPFSAVLQVLSKRNCLESPTTQTYDVMIESPLHHHVHFLFLFLLNVRGKFEIYRPFSMHEAGKRIKGQSNTLSFQPHVLKQ